MFYFYSEAFGTKLLIVDILILLFAFTVVQAAGFHVYHIYVLPAANFC